MRKNGIEEDAELHGPVEHGAAETQKILHCSGIWWRGTCVCVCGFHVPFFFLMSVGCRRLIAFDHSQAKAFKLQIEMRKIENH